MCCAMASCCRPQNWKDRRGRVLMVMFVVTWLVALVNVKAEVRLVDHGYQDIVIAINPDIKQDYSMLKRLEKYLTDTSRMLFKATKRQLYFREFIIVIPETWKKKHNYQNALDVQLDKAQIILDYANRAYGDAPYVKQYAECGQAGLYIHLTPDYLMHDDVISKWGRPEKTLVHEWAHLRWGLFDEYPIDDKDAEFYRLNGVWQPTRCTTDVSGSIRNEQTSQQCAFDYFTGKPENSCKFFPAMSTNKAAASLMFMQYLESIVEFCDDPVDAEEEVHHNVHAPNRQNRLCSYRSSWEVMRKHADFRKSMTPLPESTDTRPKFRYVQVQPRKRVLVLDTSGSMTGSSLSVMMRAASNFILGCIETGSRLGIVQFSTNATALSPLVKVNQDTDRQSLIRSLPRQADGKTSIGAGLHKALQLLESMDGVEQGGSIILITDGKENERPFISDFHYALKVKGVVVHSVAYGQRADKSIARLSRQTGGQTFFYSGHQKSTALVDGLAATIQAQGPSLQTRVPIPLLTQAVTVPESSPLNGSFLIDPTVGLESTLTVSYSGDVKVSLTSPSGVTLTQDSHQDHYQFDEESGVVQVSLPRLAEFGRWNYRLVSNGSQADAIINVQSKARDDRTETLTMTSWLSWLPDNNTIDYDPKQKITIFAEVVRGRSPVLNADVIAIIERPQSASLRLPLNDNGIGSDVIKEDGVYSAYVLGRDIQGNGRYNTKVKAEGLAGVTKVVTGISPRSSGALGTTGSAIHTQLRTEPLEEFQRVTSAGEFRVTNFKVLNGSESQEQDWLAPARITDLLVTSFQPDQALLTLTWTAVGGDLDRGTAASYVLQASTTFSHLLRMGPNDTDWTDSATETTLGRLTPKTAGQTETVTLPLSTHLNHTTLFLALRAVDAHGNVGELSNVVSVSRAEELAVPMIRGPADYSLEFYLKLVVPPAAALISFVALMLAALLWRRAQDRKGVGDDTMVEEKTLSASTFSLDMTQMNYRHEGSYRPRHPENPETWSQLARSRESLDAL